MSQRKRKLESDLENLTFKQKKNTWSICPRGSEGDHKLESKRSAFLVYFSKSRMYVFDVLLNFTTKVLLEFIERTFVLCVDSAICIWDIASLLNTVRFFLVTQEGKDCQIFRKLLVKYASLLQRKVKKWLRL